MIFDISPLKPIFSFNLVFENAETAIPQKHVRARTSCPRSLFFIFKGDEAVTTDYSENKFQIPPLC